MNHSFVKPTNGEDTCTKCKYPEVAHGEQATCECCPNVGPVEIRYGNMLMCDSCYEKEVKAHNERMKPENQQARVNAMLEKSRQIDSNILTKGDLFNAATIPAVELKAAIMQDTNIPETEKDTAYGQICLERFLKLKQVISEDRAALLKKEHEMLMWQVQTRTVANKLSEELREKFKQADLSYQPTPVKAVKPATKQGTPKKFNKEEVLAAASKYSVPAAAVQMLVTAKNMTAEDAAQLLAGAVGGKN